MDDRTACAHILIFGRPGSGKSSLAERLHDEYGYIVVRTGELLREAVRRHDALGARVESQLKSGQLVPDPLIRELLADSLEAPGAERSIFDGFPRTLGQVAMLEEFEGRLGFRVDCYLEVAISHAAAVLRMTGRRVCPVCGATYHVANKPPRVAERCDHDGARLEQRPDDALEVIEVRQKDYDDHALAILGHYQRSAPDRYRRVDGEQPFDTVYANVRRALGLFSP